MSERIWNFTSFGDKAALRDEYGRTVSYRELTSLSAQAEKWATENRLVMMLCRNTLGALASYAALIESGCAVMPLSASLPESQRQTIMNAYRPGFLLIPQDAQSAFLRLHQEAEIYDYCLLRTNYENPFPVHPELGLLLSTSGSTGGVKFVRQSRTNILSNARVLADGMDVIGEDRTITGLPLQYTYGLSVTAANLLRGATMIVTDQTVMDEAFWDLFESEEVTAFHAVPSTWAMLHQLGFFGEDFPHLRVMTQAGGKLSNELQRYYASYARQYNKRFVIMYGQSEATAAITILPPEKALEKIGSAGYPVPGVSVTLVDEERRLIEAPGIQGELICHGKNVAMGYALRGEDLIRGAEWGETLPTGDLAVREEDGAYRITGRLKRCIKVSGHRISLDDLDEKIMDHLQILSATVGSDDHPVIYVRSPEEAAEVESWIPKEFSLLRLAFRTRVIDDFPRNEGGKILYSQLNP